MHFGNSQHLKARTFFVTLPSGFCRDIQYWTTNRSSRCYVEKRRAEPFAMFTLCHGASRASHTDGRHWHLPCIAWTLLWKFVWWISWSHPTRTRPQDWHLKSCIFERNPKNNKLIDKYRIYSEKPSESAKLRPNF